MNTLVTLIITSYNRSKSIERAINSILNQTYTNFEIVIVDDGSTDNTIDILKGYTDERIRIFYHEKNKGVTAAKNTGLRNIRGEWFTFLDSDDEMFPEAIETMMKVPFEKDPAVTAISCNCIDSTTGNFSGKGLEADQYLNFETIVEKCTGQFWGLTKTELLGNDTFNEQLSGLEDTLWFKINEKARRFYIHKGLRIYHTEGLDRITVTSLSIEKKSKEFQVLSRELHMLDTLKKYSPEKIKKICISGIFYLKADNKAVYAHFYYNYLKKINISKAYKAISYVVYYSNPLFARLFIKSMGLLKNIA